MSSIAFFTYSVYTMGGEQRVVIKIANELAKRHDVTIFTMDPAYKRNRGYYKIADNIDVGFYHPYKMDIVSFILRVATHLAPSLVYDRFPSLLKRAYYHISYADLMYRCIGSNYDVIIVTAWQLSIILGMAVEKYSLPLTTIGWQHSAYDSYFDHKYLYLYNHAGDFKKYAGLLTKVVVLNEGEAEKYRNKLGINCEVMYNPKSFSSKRKSSLKNKRFIASGRIAPEKRFDLLIDAFYLFSKKDHEWELVILGDGPLRGKIDELVRKYDLTERVHLYGFVKDVIPPMLESSVFLLTSEYEGFPMCITEAYELGLPVIAFDIPAMEPLSRNGESVIVDAFNVDRYAEEMHKLAKDYDRRCEMQAKAMALADSLDIEIIGNKWEKLIL